MSKKLPYVPMPKELSDSLMDWLKQFGQYSVWMACGMGESKGQRWAINIEADLKDRPVDWGDGEGSTPEIAAKAMIRDMTKNDRGDD